MDLRCPIPLSLCCPVGALAPVTRVARTWGSSNEIVTDNTNQSRLSPINTPRDSLSALNHSTMDAPDRFRQPGLPQYQGMGQQSYTGAQQSLPTLPPLHSAASFPSLYGGHHSNPQTPQPPHTPVTSAPNGSSTMPPLQHPPLRPIQPSPSYMPMSSAYSQAPLLPTAAAHNNTHQLGGPTPSLSMNHPSLYPHPPVLANQEPEPVHVVGQQGRRGILPTHPGRPAPAAGKAPTTATKNADGKYECMHCNKTYLHLKHLKRHLLRRKYIFSQP